MVDQLCHMVLQNSWRRMKIRCWTRGAGLSPAWLSPWQYCGCTRLAAADIPPLFRILPAALLLLAACYLLIPTVAVSAAELCGSRDEDLSSKTRLNNRTNNQQTSHPLQPSSLTTGTIQNGFDGNHILSSPGHTNMCKKKVLAWDVFPNGEKHRAGRIYYKWNNCLLRHRNNGWWSNPNERQNYRYWESVKVL